jgi:quinol monooxygenase YgiN
MSFNLITRFHSLAGQEDSLVGLLTEGRDRMRGADGCESFDLFQDQAAGQSLMFVQRWSSHAAHDAAFVDRIVNSGHLEKVLAALDEPIAQSSYDVIA